jgi:hypothetical protein
MWVPHALVGFAILGLLAAASWRLAERTVAGDRLVVLLAAVVWGWLGIQLAAFATHLPLPGELPRVGLPLVVAALAVLRWVPARPRERPATDPAAVPLLAAVVVTVLVLVGLALRRPALGFDALLYHLPLPAAWAGDGGLASLPTVIDGLPVEAYPVGMEQALGWLVRLTDVTAIVVVVPPVALGLLAVATWTLARRLGALVAGAWGATVVVALSMPSLAGAAQIGNDVLAALVMTLGLVVALDAVQGHRAGRAGSLDGLLVGFLGLLLALGVKTPTACGVLVGLLLAWSVRGDLLRHLRARPWWLAPLALAAACGGAWLLRNLVLHGHPAWPLMASSFGDPLPPLLESATGRFIEQPRAAIEAGGWEYLRIGWPIVLLVPVAAVLVAAAGRERSWRRLLAACGLLGAVAWTFAPATAILGDASVVVGALRYALPCWTLLAVAVWAWPGERLRPWVAGAAAAAAIAQLALLYDTMHRIDDPLHRVPVEQTLIAILFGGAVALEVAVGTRLRALLVRRGIVLGGAVAVATALVVGLVLAAPGFWHRHAYAVRGDAEPPTSAQPILAQGSTPAWSLGAHGEPGAIVEDDCGRLAAALAAGRVVAVGPGVPADERCTFPGRPRSVDGFAVWVP